MPVEKVTLDALRARFPEIRDSEFRGDTRVVVARDAIYSAMQFLRDERGFDMLIDVTCVDYLNYREAPDRFGLVYLLANTAINERLTVRVYVSESDPRAPSVVPLWEGANWLEREVWDMFGIVFEGHPDHRRILMPDEFTAFPLRKDYPLRGRGERHNFPVIARSQA